MKLKNILNKERIYNNATFIKLIFFVIFILKTIIFLKVGTSEGGRSFDGWTLPNNIYTIIEYLALLAILIFPSFICKGKNQLRYLLIIDCLYSILLIADLWYYRASGYYLGIRYILYNDLFNPFNNSLIQPDILDLLFIIDIPVIIFMLKKLTYNKGYNRRPIIGILGIVICVAVAYSVRYNVDIKNVTKGKVKIMGPNFYTQREMVNASPIGYHIYEAKTAIEKKFKKPNESQMKKVDEWLEWNKENVPDNKYKGIFKGKNVIFLQVESLENFVINKKVKNQEITPNLNELIKHSLYFDNIYEQNNAGNSIDCDMMANTSLLTLGKSITFITNPEVQYESLPRILSQNGYYTASTHAENGGDWKWAEAHKNALGFDNVIGKYSYNIDEKVGFGLSDRSFLKQYLSKLKTFKEPFYSTIATLSSHGPFDIQEKYRELKLPKEVDKSYLGGYFQSVHYTDKEIGKFIKGLKESGLLENTLLVIYGDHTGVHKYYNKQIQNVPLEGDWWKKQDHKIPLIIYGENIKPETISTYGGQIDIEPTVLYLLGINTKDKYFMGRNLLNTKRNSTVLKGSKVIGNPTEEERERLKEAYKIAEYIINNDYFVNRGLVH